MVINKKNVFIIIINFYSFFFLYASDFISFTFFNDLKFYFNDVSSFTYDSTKNNGGKQIYYSIDNIKNVIDIEFGGKITFWEMLYIGGSMSVPTILEFNKEMIINGRPQKLGSYFFLGFEYNVNKNLYFNFSFERDCTHPITPYWGKKKYESYSDSAHCFLHLRTELRL